MGTLKSSIVQPALVENELARMEFRKEKNRNERMLDDLAAALEKWKKLKKTPAGMLLIEISDYEIKQYEDNLSKTVSDLVHLGDITVINEKRAEWRGCLAVWKSIKFNLIEYERRLAELKAMLAKEEEKQSADKAKILNKYS